VRLGALFLAAGLVVACGAENVVVSGDVQYDDHTAGDILLKLVEDETCTGRMCKTPGDTVASVRLSEPGPFVLEGKVDNQASYIVLLGYALGVASRTSECEAGGAEAFEVESQHDVALVLQPGICPALK
jgi:hypothetical protein